MNSPDPPEKKKRTRKPRVEWRYEIVQAEGEVDMEGLAYLLAQMFINYQNRTSAGSLERITDTPMTLIELAQKLNAQENIDASLFQRKARILQSLWRIENNLDCALIGKGDKERYIGSRLLMPFAKDSLANYLTDGIIKIVDAEVRNPKAKSGKLYGKPRIYNDLLSSQPLCFNLFGELVTNLPLASKVVTDLSKGRFCEVVDIQFEMSPGRGDNDYLGDNTAFDVFLECRTQSGKNGFIGIEVKYHENLIGKPGKHHTRYDEVADEMQCFPKDRSLLKTSPLQQLWRDHLLSGCLKKNKCYEDAQFIVLYPKDNGHVADAIQQYKVNLYQQESFDSWTIEEFVSSLKKHSDADWIQKFYNRYLAFEKVDALMIGK